MAVSIHGLLQKLFYKPYHHQGQAAVLTRAVTPARCDSDCLKGHKPPSTSPPMAVHANFQGHHHSASAFKSLPSGTTAPPSPESTLPPSFSAFWSPLPTPRPQRLQGRSTFASPDRSPVVNSTGPKRRRALHDVDGPHTGSLGCKKRRLRRTLITSRLSRPYSSPATHILNREAAAAGGERFLKMAVATAAAARKLAIVVVPTPPTADWGSGRVVAAAQIATVVPADRIHHLATAEMVRRAAIMNRFRIRVCDEAMGRGDRTALELTACAALLRAGAGWHGVGFVTNSKMPPAQSPRNLFVQEQVRLAGLASHRSAATSFSRVAQLPVPASPAKSPSLKHHVGVAVRSLAPGSSTKNPRPRIPGRISPYMRPLRDPELSALRSQTDCDSLDDADELSFPATDYSDDFLENNIDEVYTDFGAIFGGGGIGEIADDGSSCLERGGSADEERQRGDEHFEDSMDDLDGIPWDAR